MESGPFYSLTYALEFKLRSPGLHDTHLYLLSYLTGPESIFSFIIFCLVFNCASASCKQGLCVLPCSVCVCVWLWEVLMWRPCTVREVVQC